MVHIVDGVADSGLSLLFDFRSMVNAHARPQEAMRAQSKHITEMHIKDCLVEPDRGGWALKRLRQRYRSYTLSRSLASSAFAKD